MLPEALLMEQLKQGVPAAYVILVDRFEAALYRFFFCDHRDHHLAQEQTAETFAQLVRSLPAMRGGCEQLRAFVFGTARHVQLRGWRKRKHTHGSLAEANEVSDRAPSPATVAAERELLGRVLAAIGNLEDPLRNVLLLRFVEECSIDEVAAALDMPVGTVKSHIHRGRIQLQQIFAEEECKP